MIAEVLKFVYPHAVPFVDYAITNNGVDPLFISEWNLPTPQPTAEELAAAAASPEFAAWKQARIDAEARELRRQQNEASERTALEQAAVASVARCDEIIAGATIMTAAQVRAAVVDLAKIVKRLVKITARTES